MTASATGGSASVGWASAPPTPTTPPDRREPHKTPRREVTSYTRDKLTRATAATNPLGNRTTLTYAADGALRRVKAPLGAVTIQVCDAGHRLAATVNPLGNRTSYAYDSRDNRVRV